MSGRPTFRVAHPDLDAVGALVRRNDPDRFLTALFAPPARRDSLLLLYALNHELARARAMVSEPALALIRLHWWREVVEGACRRHEVAAPLAAAIAAGMFDPADLLALIDAREAEAGPALPTLAAWRDYLLGSAGGLMVTAGRLLGVVEPEGLRAMGAAYGAAGVLRAAAALARQGRCLLPEDVLAAHGLSAAAVIASGGELGRARPALAAAGRALLAAPHPLRLPRAKIAAALPGVLAARDLARDAADSFPRGLADRLAVAWAAWSGRLPMGVAPPVHSD